MGQSVLEFFGKAKRGTMIPQKRKTREGLEFFAGYVVEKVVPDDLQHRVVFWGIIGALILRGVFIMAGGAFLETFHWAIYVFGCILILTGARLLVRRDEEEHPEPNPVTRLASRMFPVAIDHRGKGFVVHSVRLADEHAVVPGPRDRGGDGRRKGSRTTRQASGFSSP